MVSVIWAAISASLGLLVYLLAAFLGFLYPIETRKRVGEMYFKMAARCLKQFSFVRRVLSGYDVMPIGVDAEQKLLKVTLSSSVIGSDKEYQFNDPDNRIKRLFNKPVAVAFELIPAAISPGLGEIGACVDEKNINSGFWNGDPKDPESDVRIDPYVEMDSHLQLVDPIDAFNLVTNAVDPENIKTAEELTRKRYEKYGSRVGLEETLGVILGFVAGVGTIVVLRYLNNTVLEGGGGGTPDVTLPMGGMVVPPSVAQHAIDAVVIGL